MKKIILVILLLPLFSFFCISRKVQKSFIEVQNKLRVSVYCFPKTPFPGSDENYLNKKFISDNGGPYRIKARRKKRLFYQNFCVRDVWYRAGLKDTLHIWVVDEKVYKDNSWGYIDSNNLILRKLAYTYDDIINNGCKIIVK